MAISTASPAVAGAPAAHCPWRGSAGRGEAEGGEAHAGHRQATRRRSQRRSQRTRRQEQRQQVLAAAKGGLPGLVKLNIARNLSDYVDTLGKGIVGIGSLGYVVPILKSGRESFCADVSYFFGPRPSDPWGFMEGAPDFAVEVMNHTDFYPGAELQMASKRADYLEAGTQVVWEVNPIEKVVHVYRAT